MRVLGVHPSRVWVIALVVGALCCVALAEQDGGGEIGDGVQVGMVRVEDFVAFRLENGDLVRGVVTAVSTESITIRHEMFGELVLPADAVIESRRAVGEDAVSRAGVPAEKTPDSVTNQDLTPGVGGAPADVGQGEEKAEEKETEQKQEEKPKPPKEEKGEWKTNLTLGLSGSTGTTDRTNFRANFSGDFNKKGQRLNLRTTYLLNLQDDERTQNRFDLSARNEWFEDDGTFRVFLEGALNLDEFRDYDARVNGGGGVGFKPIKNENTDLLIRAGLGASRDIGAPDNTIRPEAILGLELNQKLFKNQRLVGSVEAFPDLEESGEYRLTARGTWEIRLDAKQNLSLQIGVEHRRDTHQPRGRQSDTDYFASVVVRF